MEIQSHVQDVAMLWTNPDPDNLRRIVDLCNEIAGAHAAGDVDQQVDRGSLRRMARLAASAQRRAAECLAIQAQTGNYSVHGKVERISILSTAGWEG